MPSIFLLFFFIYVFLKFIPNSSRSRSKNLQSFQHNPFLTQTRMVLTRIHFAQSFCRDSGMSLALNLEKMRAYKKLGNIAREIREMNQHTCRGTVVGIYNISLIALWSI